MTTVSAITSLSHETDLNEAELRELYDNEEIDRFLRLFSAHVTEVYSSEIPSYDQAQSAALASTGESLLAHNVDSATNPSAPVSLRSIDESLLQQAVRYWLLPHLPPPRPPPQQFTLGGLRLTTERLFVAMDPVYLPFITRMARLAMWKDKKTSSVYCTVFWILWYYNVLLPALLLRILCALLERKMFQHPTLAELQNHRLQITRAAELGDALSDKFSASSFGAKEVWRLLKIVNKTTKQRNKPSSKAKKADETIQPEQTTPLDAARDDRDSEELKSLVLYVLHQIADCHERVKNIFLWRRPESSWVYAVGILCTFLLVLVLPAKYLNKMTYFVAGFTFWHVIPIIASIPPSERLRLPVPFGDVPTDADYAMELISQRTAAGLPVTPSKPSKKDKTAQVDTYYSGKNTQRTNESEPSSHSVDWKKWGDRAAQGKSWADERLINRGRPKETTPAPPTLPPRKAPSSSTIETEQPIETHTYPVQHASGPGLVALTSNDLRFTPLMSLEPKIIIPYAQIRGVKKTGLLKGLVIRASLRGEEREEKFRWVGGRDELFARLVGTEGMRWMRT